MPSAYHGHVALRLGCCSSQLKRRGSLLFRLNVCAWVSRSRGALQVFFIFSLIEGEYVFWLCYRPGAL
jgi:hypothetical protein